MKRSVIVKVILSLILSVVMLIPITNTAKAASSLPSLSIVPEEINVYSSFTLVGTGFIANQDVYFGACVSDSDGNHIQTSGWGSNKADAEGNVEHLVEGGVASFLTGVPPEIIASVIFEAGGTGVVITHLAVVLRPYWPSLTLGSLITTVNSLLVPDGLRNSLIVKLENAQEALGNGNEEAAVSQLNAFINAVEAQRGKKISNEQADELISKAQQLIDDI